MNHHLHQALFHLLERLEGLVLARHFIAHAAQVGNELCVLDGHARLVGEVLQALALGRGHACLFGATKQQTAGAAPDLHRGCDDESNTQRRQVLGDQVGIDTWR